ncbi:MAG TPA: hypothetical protein VKU80_13150 [Planctomycetota bacterium]|nr:hypothetical protein [Planctomycetota bacterium]
MGKLTPDLAGFRCLADIAPAQEPPQDGASLGLADIPRIRLAGERAFLPDLRIPDDPDLPYILENRGTDGVIGRDISYKQATFGRNSLI